jgi:hypothetical protein
MLSSSDSTATLGTPNTTNTYHLPGDLHFAHTATPLDVKTMLELMIIIIATLIAVTLLLRYFRYNYSQHINTPLNNDTIPSASNFLLTVSDIGGLRTYYTCEQRHVIDAAPPFKLLTTNGLPIYTQ